MYLSMKYEKEKWDIQTTLKKIAGCEILDVENLILYPRTESLKERAMGYYHDNTYIILPHFWFFLSGGL